MTYNVFGETLNLAQLISQLWEILLFTVSGTYTLVDWLVNWTVEGRCEPWSSVVRGSDCCCWNDTRWNHHHSCRARCSLQDDDRCVRDSGESVGHAGLYAHRHEDRVWCWRLVEWVQLETLFWACYIATAKSIKQFKWHLKKSVCELTGQDALWRSWLFPPYKYCYLLTYLLKNVKQSAISAAISGFITLFPTRSDLVVGRSPTRRNVEDAVSRLVPSKLHDDGVQYWMWVSYIWTLNIIGKLMYCKDL